MESCIKQRGFLCDSSFKFTAPWYLSTYLLAGNSDFVFSFRMVSDYSRNWWNHFHLCLFQLHGSTQVSKYFHIFFWLVKNHCIIWLSRFLNLEGYNGRPLAWRKAAIEVVFKVFKVLFSLHLKLVVLFTFIYFFSWK